MQHRDALRKFRSLFLSRRSDAPAEAVPGEPALSGPPLVDQEPDLAKEAGQHTRDFSAWAAGGQPSE